MQHFLEISELSLDEIENLLERALHFKYQSHYPHLSGYAVANLFYENSTRTRISFEMAANHLSMKVVNIDLHKSSESKGETIEDTLLNLSAMGISHAVIRHSQNGLPKQLAHTLGNKIHIINAGDGQNAHPSQALLDLMTITEQKPDLKNLKIVILGNIRHSRVANSLQSLFKTMQVGELVCIAPKVWQPQIKPYGRVTEDIEDGLKNADVIICLRVQKERLQETEQFDLQEYRKHFALTPHTLKLAHPKAMIMHPGPINHNVEIDSVLVDCPQSFILHQVQNGVFMRMGILEGLT